MQEIEQRTEKISRSDAARVVGNDVRGSAGCVWEQEDLVVATVVGTWAASRTEELLCGSGCALAAARVGGMELGGDGRGGDWGSGDGEVFDRTGGGKRKMVKARWFSVFGFWFFWHFCFRDGVIFRAFFTSARLKISRKNFLESLHIFSTT
jgi:hypothetical protein